jgi:hypothetical protein
MGALRAHKLMAVESGNFVVQSKDCVNCQIADKEKNLLFVDAVYFLCVIVPL